MSTIVGTNIEVTNIKFDSDTTSMIISNTGQITAQGEGTATTNLQQGLAKTWGTVVSQATNDSFNNSSDTDVGAGQFEHNFTNNFAAANYVSSASHGGLTSIRTYTATNWYDATMYTTSKSRTGTYDGHGSAYADRDFSVARFGDLA